MGDAASGLVPRSKLGDARNASWRPQVAPMPEPASDLAPPDEAEVGTVATSRGARMFAARGSWLLLGVVNSLGLHRASDDGAERNQKPVPASSLRVALDAPVVVALALGECVEGVHRQRVYINFISSDKKRDFIQPKDDKSAFY